MYKCPTCGAGLVFNPNSQKLQCLSCRNEYDPENVENMRLDQAREIENGTQEVSESEYEAVSYKCSHCGAELITTDETITTFCSFCRMGTMLDRKLVKKRKPDYVIPFSITKKECEKIYIDKIKKSFFAPKEMIDLQEVKKIRGIYMPYWIYSFEKHGNVSAKGSQYSYSSGDYSYYDDYSLTTKVDAECNGIIHDATSNFSDRLSEAIAPFSVKDKKNFSPAYLSGFYADNEDINEAVYSDESQKIANAHISSELGKDKEFGKYSAKPTVVMDNSKTELALFPVYFMSTKNRTGDRISYAVINGQTGKIAADIPIDFKKFIIFALILTIPIFLGLNNFLTISMSGLLGVSFIFNLICLIILMGQNSKIKKRENGTDDKGMQFKNYSQNKNKTSLKEKYTQNSNITKPLLGLILSILLFFLELADDMYYYILAFISISMAILSFYNIITKLNILTSQKLPQLGKRGGDENA